MQALQDGDNSDESMLIIREILDYLQQYPQVCHHPREEVIIDNLIDLIENTDQATCEKLQAIKGEHSRIEQLLHELYQQVNLAVESSYDGMIEQIRVFLDFYYNHLETEEKLIFPLAMELFSKTDLDEVDKHFSDVFDPLFTAHEETENHFRRLFKMILAHDAGEFKCRKSA